MGLFSIFKKQPREPLDKEDWEFEWQRDNWCETFSEPEAQRKVLEYWQKYRHLDEILEATNLSEESVVLDVGCGISTVLHYVPGERFGIDPLGERYTEIYAYPEGVTIQRGYGEDVPFDDAKFDVVFSSNCIDHTTSPEQTVAEVTRVLKPNGHFVLTCEVFDKDHGQRNEGHPYSMTKDRLLGLVEGFQMLEHWVSPWIGLRNFVLGNPGTKQHEHIMLLKKVV